MNFWKKIIHWLGGRRGEPPHLPVAERLDEETLASVLKDAAYLRSRGVSVRDLYEGEEVPDVPEVGEDPMPGD